jgi:hypothetical protein
VVLIRAEGLLALSLWWIAPPIAISIVALVVSVLAAILPYWRRPSLSLHEDAEYEHSRVEGNGVPHLRALVHNKKGKRSARHARVVLDGYRKVGADGSYTRLGSPFLGWPSVFGQDNDSYVEVIFPNSSRPVGLGQFHRTAMVDAGDYTDEGGEVHVKSQRVFFPATGPASVQAPWSLHLELAESFGIDDGRDWLSPGEWTLRLIVGADDGDAQTFEVDVAWGGKELNADQVLRAALDRLAIRSV